MLNDHTKRAVETTQLGQFTSTNKHTIMDALPRCTSFLKRARDDFICGSSAEMHEITATNDSRRDMINGLHCIQWCKNNCNNSLW